MKYLLLLFACHFLWWPDTVQAQSRRFGWVGDSGSKPAAPFALRPGFTAVKIAPKSDLTALMPPIWDQGELGSCVGHGMARAIDYATHKQTQGFYGPSRLFLYYSARVLEGAVEQDQGCQIVDAVKGARFYGAPSEALWPYNVQDFARRPPEQVYADGLTRQTLKAWKVDNTDGRSIRKALSEGFPVVFGSLVYRGIYNVTADKPVLPMPRRGERPIGGHCMTITGHDDARQVYTVDNSWGTSWGKAGRCFIPYAYIHNPRLTEDCWVVEQVETP